MLLRPIGLLAGLAGPMRELRPYAVLALIVLPGGFLIALLFWAFRNRLRLRARVRRVLAKVAAVRTDLIIPG